MATRVPERSEAADYYFTYIDQISSADIRRTLEAQSADALAILGGISEQQSLHRYAPGKWSIREVWSHVTDAERVFTFRALWFARGLEGELPSFDQDLRPFQPPRPTSGRGAAISTSSSPCGPRPRRSSTAFGTTHGIGAGLRAPSRSPSGRSPGSPRATPLTTSGCSRNGTWGHADTAD